MSTFDNPQIAETKDSFNSRGSANKAYTNYSTHDPEIIMLKSKFEKRGNKARRARFRDKRRKREQTVFDRNSGRSLR